MTNTKFWGNEIASSTNITFAVNRQFYLTLPKVKKPLPIFLKNVKISIWTCPFLKM